jgi:dinuclear metal center YbgI/SA1388 family protein
LSLRVSDISAIMEERAPLHLAMDWDNVGLMLGSNAAPVKNVLVALNYNDAVLREALGRGANLVLTHHPFIFEALRAIRTDSSHGALIQETMLNGINVYSAHTNLDVAEEGVNQSLAEAFSLEDIQVLQKTAEDPLLKLAVFVPLSHLDAVRQALAEAGAGWIGSYSHCSFRTSGIGTLKPREGTRPFIGEAGQLEEVEEVRLETILPTSLRSRVVAALLKAHPYEEAAFDLYPLVNSGRPAGLGRIGQLPKALSLQALVLKIKKTLQVKHVNVVGEGTKTVHKMAVCGGSGGHLAAVAAQEGADVLLTGDVRYHQAEEALKFGIAVVDAGHAATENVAIQPLVAFLQRRVREEGHAHEVFASMIDPAYWKTM